jgi:hypothetical protein
MKRSRKKSVKKLPRKLLLDIDYINKITPNLHSLKTALKKVQQKRVGLFANKPIKKNETIAYYLVKAYKTLKNDYTYAVTLYEKGREVDNFTGDLCPESLQMPTKDGITYWAYFSNEPSMGQKENSYLKFKNILASTMNKKLVEGDFVLYPLIATRDIKKGDEIVWCYGEDYERDYQTICKE